MSCSSYDTFVSTNWWKGRDYILRPLSRQSRSPVNRCPERYLALRTRNYVRCRKLKWRCAGKWKYNLWLVDVRLLGTADTRGTRLPPPGSASGTDSEWHDGSLSWHVSPRHSQRHCARPSCELLTGGATGFASQGWSGMQTRSEVTAEMKCTGDSVDADGSMLRCLPSAPFSSPSRPSHP